MALTPLDVYKSGYGKKNFTNEEMDLRQKIWNMDNKNYKPKISFEKDPSGNEVRWYHCDGCHLKYASHKSVKRHRRKHVGDSVYKCQHCGRIFTEMYHLERHIRTLHDILDPVVCRHCDVSFMDKHLCKEHMLVCQKRKNAYKPGIERFKCNVCLRDYSKITTLKYHMATHDVKPRHRCDQCGYVSPSFSSLKAHSANMHNLSDPIQCPKCPETFEDKTLYRIHYKTHVKPKVENSHGLYTNPPFEVVSPDFKPPLPELLAGKTASKSEVKPAKRRKAGNESSDDDFLVDFSPRGAEEPIRETESVEKRSIRCEGCQRTYRTERQMKSHKCAQFWDDEMEGKLVSTAEKAPVSVPGHPPEIDGSNKQQTEVIGDKDTSLNDDNNPPETDIEFQIIKINGQSMELVKVLKITEIGDDHSIAVVHIKKRLDLDCTTAVDSNPPGYYLHSEIEITDIKPVITNNNIAHRRSKRKAAELLEDESRSNSPTL